MQTLSIGRIVHYTLSEQDAQAINQRRADFYAFQRSLKQQPEPGQSGRSGHVGHIGNQASEGEVYPAVVVRTWEEHLANLQVLLDGNDTYWATSRREGEGPNTWAWPQRV
jgi:hypothetical protein